MQGWRCCSGDLLCEDIQLLSLAQGSCFECVTSETARAETPSIHLLCKDVQLLGLVDVSSLPALKPVLSSTVGLQALCRQAPQRKAVHVMNIRLPPLIQPHVAAVDRDKVMLLRLNEVVDILLQQLIDAILQVCSSYFSPSQLW